MTSRVSLHKDTTKPNWSGKGKEDGYSFSPRFGLDFGRILQSANGNKCLKPALF